MLSVTGDDERATLDRGYFVFLRELLRQLQFHEDMLRDKDVDCPTVQALRVDMVMLGDDVARLEQSAIDEGSMFEMGYFSSL